MNIDEEIQDTIVYEVFRLFSQDKFQEGKELLNKIYVEKYNETEGMYAKRLLLHNLAWVEDELGEKENAKMHIKMLKELVEKEPHYILNNMRDYCLILNLYCEILRDEISDDEYREINLLNAYYHHNDGSLGREYVALTNVYESNGQWDEIVKLIRELREKGEEDYFVESILEELLTKNKEAYIEVTNILKGGDVNV